MTNLIIYLVYGKRSKAQNMKLNQFLKSENITYKGFQEFCKQRDFHFSIGTLNKWISGQRIPKGTNLQRLQSITDGKVTVMDFEYTRNEKDMKKPLKNNDLDPGTA